MRPLIYQFCWKLGFEIGILRPSRPNTCSLFNHGTNQCRSRTGQVANFAKRDNSILIYTLNCCRAGIEFNRLYTVYLFEGTFLKTIRDKTISCQCVIKTLAKSEGRLGGSMFPCSLQDFEMFPCSPKKITMFPGILFSPILYPE